MKILTVCSGLDFINYTRRATIEAIHKINPELDILLFNSVLNIRKKKNTPKNISFYFYHFWTVERLRKYRIFSFFEYCVRFIKWKSFFYHYDAVFLIDPNQYYLLPYLNKNQKIVYLLRDPSIILDPDNYRREFPIIIRADLILGISKSLCGYYFEKYYGFIPDNVKLWPNSVDMNLWNFYKWESYIVKKTRSLIGLAGNIDFVIDIELLIFVISHLSEYDFEIAGKLDLNNNEKVLWNELLRLPNIEYLGFLSYNEFPRIVINWDVGLVAAKQDQEYAHYLNNNKQYQYLALGKPFVTFHLDADYEEFEDMVFIAESRIDYIEKIHQAVKKSLGPDVIEKGQKIALRNSADVRAKAFIDYVSR